MGRSKPAGEPPRRMCSNPPLAQSRGRHPISPSALLALLTSSGELTPSLCHEGDEPTRIRCAIVIAMSNWNNRIAVGRGTCLLSRRLRSVIMLFSFSMMVTGPVLTAAVEFLDEASAESHHADGAPCPDSDSQVPCSNDCPLLLLSRARSHLFYFGNTFTGKGAARPVLSFRAFRRLAPGRLLLPNFPSAARLRNTSPQIRNACR